MAYVNASRTAQVSFSDRFAAILKVAKDAMGRRRLFRQTLFELNGLSDRDLTDMGLSRANIAEVAREAAYKA